MVSETTIHIKATIEDDGSVNVLYSGTAVGRDGASVALTIPQILCVALEAAKGQIEAQAEVEPSVIQLAPAGMKI